MSKYISCADTAKLIRKELKTNFPGIKFSVRSNTYAGGASIDVKWTDGPSRPDVEKIVKIFQGSTFDSSIDLRSYVDATYDGEEVHFGADHVMCDRRMTRLFVETILKVYYTRHSDYIGKIKIVGSDVDARVDAWILGYYAEQGINKLLHNTDEKDMHRPYEAEEEREQAEHDEWIRNEPERRAQQEKEEAEEVAREQARAKARKEQEEHQRQYRERQREQLARTPRAPFTRTTALSYLGLSFSATNEQILHAFRQKVKEAFDGKGDFKGDMDLLTKAKAAALQR